MTSSSLPLLYLSLLGSLAQFALSLQLSNRVAVQRLFPAEFPPNQDFFPKYNKEQLIKIENTGFGQQETNLLRSVQSIDNGIILFHSNLSNTRLVVETDLSDFHISGFAKVFPSSIY